MCLGFRLSSVSLRYGKSMTRRLRLGGYPHDRGPLRRAYWPTAAGSTFGVDTASRIARVEAVLFLSREPLSSRKLAQLANLADGTEARTLVRRLEKRYLERGYAFRVEEIAGGFQLLTRPPFSRWVRRLQQSPVQVRLSGPAMETLAVVAYRQPVMRAEVEAIRGVQCGEMLRQLLDRDLVRIVGRSDELGRPFLYGTTKRFLRVFGIRHLEELPRAEKMRNVDTKKVFASHEDEGHDGEGSEPADNKEKDVSYAQTSDTSEANTRKPKKRVADDVGKDAVNQHDGNGNSDGDFDFDEDGEYEYLDEDDEDDDDELDDDDDFDDDLDDDWEEVDDDELNVDDWNEDDDEDDDEDDEDWEE